MAVNIQWGNVNTGFFGATPVARPSAYTQTYTTASKTVPNATATASTPTGTQTTPWGFSSEADFNAVATKANALITDVDNLRKVVTQIIDDLQSLGLLQ